MFDKLKSALKSVASALGSARQKAESVWDVAIGAIIVLVVAGVALMIGPYVVASVYSNLNTANLPASAVTTIGNVFNGTLNAFGLAVVILIIIVAAVIIMVLMGAFGRAPGGGGGGSIVT